VQQRTDILARHQRIPDRRTANVDRFRCLNCIRDILPSLRQHRNNGIHSRKSRPVECGNPHCITNHIRFPKGCDSRKHICAAEKPKLCSWSSQSPRLEHGFKGKAWTRTLRFYRPDIHVTNVSRGSFSQRYPRTYGRDLALILPRRDLIGYPEGDICIDGRCRKRCDYRVGPRRWIKASTEEQNAGLVAKQRLRCTQDLRIIIRVKSPALFILFDDRKLVGIDGRKHAEKQWNPHRK
jgi:hypothetical protein